MSIASIITIVLSAVLTENIVLSKTLGICPLLGTSKKTDSAVGMGLAVTFVITVSSVVCYGLFQCFPFGTSYICKPLCSFW